MGFSVKLECETAMTQMCCFDPVFKSCILYTFLIYIHESRTSIICHSSCGINTDCFSSQPLSLGLVALLKARWREFLCTLALKCSSWSAVNQGTSQRCPCGSIGFEEYESVSNANCMGSRFLGFIMHGNILGDFDCPCKGAEKKHGLILWFPWVYAYI